MGNYIGQLAALGAAMAWTVSGLFDEHFTKGAWGSAVNFFRIVLGLFLVSLLSLFTTGHWIVLPEDMSGAIWFVLSGVVSFAIGDTFLMIAFQTMGARITMIIFSLAPVLTAALGYLLFNETLTPRNLLGMTLTLSGLLIVITSKDEAGKTSYPKAGIQAAILAGIGQGVGVILSKMGLQSFEPIAGTQLRLFSAILGIMIYFSLVRRWKDAVRIFRHKHAWKAVVGDAVVATLIGVSLSMFAIKNTKAAIASTLMSVMPVLIIPISIWLKERISLKEVFGAILSVAGIAILFL